MPATARRPLLPRMFLGFVPFIAQGSLAGLLEGAGATAVALVLALVPVAVDWPRRRVKILEVVAVLWFAGVLAAGFAGHPLPARHGHAAVMALLACVAWSSLLLGRPFTEQYAREDWPEPFWSEPAFRSINRRITALWGAIFTADAALLGAFAHTGWSAVTAAALTLAGTATSVLLPPFLARRRLRRKLAISEPCPWPLPDLASPRPSGVDWDVAIIGAGIAGLSAGALLARQGRRVLVCETHDRPGGCCSQWHRRLSPRRLGTSGHGGTFVFDAGVHDISGLHERGAIRALLRRLEVEDRIQWRPMTQEIVTPSDVVAVGHGRASVAAALTRLTPGSAAGIAAFLETMEAIFDDMYGEVEHTNFIPRMPRDIDRLLSWPRRHPAGFRWMERPFAEMLEYFVDDPAARRNLGYLSGYLTDRPESLTVRRMAPIFGMLFTGGHYPVGGSQTLPDLLAAVIAAHGGDVRLKSPVTKVLIEGGRATGVILAEDRVERARAVVGAGDAKRLLLDLVGRDHLPAAEAEAMATARPACSAFMVSLALDMVPAGAPLKFIRDHDGGGLGIMVPSLADPSLCPPGHAVMTLLELVPQSAAGAWDRAAPDYRAAKAAHGDALIARAEAAILDLSSHIVHREDASPRTFERYTGASGGAIYGLETGGYCPHRRSPVPGLFLAGHGTGLGAGVEAAAISGMLVAEDLGAYNPR